MLDGDPPVLKLARRPDPERLHPHFCEFEEPAAVGVECLGGHRPYPLSELAFYQVGLLSRRALDQGGLLFGGAQLGSQACGLHPVAASRGQITDRRTYDHAKHEPGKQRDRVHVTQWLQPLVTVWNVTRQGSRIRPRLTPPLTPRLTPAAASGPSGRSGPGRYVDSRG